MMAASQVEPWYAGGTQERPPIPGPGTETAPQPVDPASPQVGNGLKGALQQELDPFPAQVPVKSHGLRGRPNQDPSGCPGYQVHVLGMDGQGDLKVRRNLERKHLSTDG